MKRILIILFAFGSISIGIAQPNVNDDEMVGFACSIGGTPSNTVQKVSHLIDKRKYKVIIKLLDSDNNAERFLAVVVCEKLTELKKTTLTEELKGKISEIYKSDGIVSVCSGCTYWDNLTLKDMLNKENNMRISANYWLDYKFKKK